ncbi:hypothetical protein AgCh_011860 [Apium graveolens]
MFPDELSIFLSDREMKLAIDVAPEMKPVTKALHKMAPVKMRKLAKQMLEMLEEEVIRPSVSHKVHRRGDGEVGRVTFLASVYHAFPAITHRLVSVLARLCACSGVLEAMVRFKQTSCKTCDADAYVRAQQRVHSSSSSGSVDTIAFSVYAELRREFDMLQGKYDRLIDRLKNVYPDSRNYEGKPKEQMTARLDTLVQYVNIKLEEMPSHRDRTGQIIPPKKKNPTTTSTTDPNILRLLETLQQQTNAIAQQQLTLQKQFENQDNHEPHQPPDPPVSPRQVATFKAFQNMNPPAFHDTTDPIIANTWIKEIERAFELVQLGDDQKTPYATYFLKGEVIYWWESVKAMEVNQQVSWERFKKLFLEKYYPKYMQNQMELKFLELKQENMSVLEYEKKFTELSRDRVAIIELDTYAGVVQKAALIENNGMQSRKERDNKKRKVPFYGEKSEAGNSQDRNVKRIGFHKGGNFQKKGNLS